jgi:hypothetical protein
MSDRIDDETGAVAKDWRTEPPPEPDWVFPALRAADPVTPAEPPQRLRFFPEFDAFISALLMIAGACVAGYFFLFYDTTVQGAWGPADHRVHNVGLMNDRMVGVVVGIGMAVVGAILSAFGRR